MLAQGETMVAIAGRKDEARSEMPRTRTREMFARDVMRGGSGRVRLGTLNNLRWLAVAGQSVALVIVYFVMGYQLPLLACIAPIAASAGLNLVLALAYPASKRLTAREATAFLAYDILQLAALLYLTGGIENPFALLFIAPVVISAATLNLANTLVLAAIGFIAISVLGVYYLPLPWLGDAEFHLPLIYRIGIWFSLNLGIGFTSIYAWRIASESARMSTALAASQMALARENRLSALGALAAAAAHELGTPLGTIAVVARELEREWPADSAQGEDVRLLREQAERCRAILTRLSQPEETALGSTERMPLGALLDDIAAPHRGVDVAIVIDMQPGSAPKIWRAPELLHGLGNLIENAADFARSEVRIRARWDNEALSVEVSDDGPGFAPDILERIGEPYVSSRPLWRTMMAGTPVPDGDHEGMGLGFFIAQTLIAQTGGSVTALNRPETEGGGAVVSVRWPRGAVDGETPPVQRSLT
jgi:two-component system sensor histidine kinase RegB